MKTPKTEIAIPCQGGDPLQGLLWGNNAALICRCGKLLGSNTSDEQYIIICKCGREYEILRKASKKDIPRPKYSKFHLSAPTGIKVIK